MAHLTIQIGASIVIPMPTRLARSGRRHRRIGGARLRWLAIHEAAILDPHPRQDAWVRRVWRQVSSAGSSHDNNVSGNGSPS